MVMVVWRMMSSSGMVCWKLMMKTIDSRSTSAPDIEMSVKMQYLDLHIQHIQTQTLSDIVNSDT